MARRKHEIQKAERDKKARTISELREAGGKVVTIRFEPEAVAALERAANLGFSINKAVNEAVQGEWPEPE
jgi:hypothetical protein